MSVLVRGMEMPKTCVECNFHQYHSFGEYVCVATPLLYPLNLANYKGGRKDFCPLIEVQSPHGRLIDADALNTYDVSPIYEFCVMGVTEEDIGLAETIIEAEGSEE